MAALSAARLNPPIRAGLVAADKPNKLALAPAMCKQVVILNAILRTGIPWCVAEIAV